MTHKTTPALSEPYPGALYGVLKVKFIPAPGPFRRLRRVPRVRVFCVVCKNVCYVSRKQLTRGTCPGCLN